MIRSTYHLVASTTVIGCVVCVVGGVLGWRLCFCVFVCGWLVFVSGWAEVVAGVFPWVVVGWFVGVGFSGLGPDDDCGECCDGGC